MEAFVQHIAAWQPFFITLAGIGATLAGLLFVAVSLHPANKHEDAKINLRRLAENTFSDLVQVLFLGLFFIVPGQPPLFYSIAIILTVAFGLREPARLLWEAWRDRAHEIHREHYLRRMRLSMAARILLCLGAVMSFLYHDTGDAIERGIFLVFSGSMMLLISAMRNAWFLILQEAT